MKEKESLSEKSQGYDFDGNKEPRAFIYMEEDTKEKIQNAQKRLKKEMTVIGKKDLILSPEAITEANHITIDKIFKEEFGDKLI